MTKAGVDMIKLIDKLAKDKILSKQEYIRLLSQINETQREYLHKRAREVALQHFSNKIYSRGLIEISNYCKADCFYCGIRRGNKNVERYRLTKDEILSCCSVGYDLGFRTFVMQSGEDPYFTDDVLTDIISTMREKYPDCAITLSVGERTRASYEKLYSAGANRFLLRHETYDWEHYLRLHPPEQTAKNRQECLANLKDIGFQTGTGIMVGSPYQTNENIADDFLFIAELKPEMVGIGPFIPHNDTPFRDKEPGDVIKTLIILSIVRLMLPNALLPSTTALGTINSNGREMGILAGANVVMPNLSPLKDRAKYSLYNNKIGTGDEAAEGRAGLRKRISDIGYELVDDRGDFRGIERGFKNV